MPSLIRFLVFCGVVAGLVYGAMFALIFYVEPKPREISVRVPTERVNPPAQALDQNGNPLTGTTAPFTPNGQTAPTSFPGEPNTAAE